MAQGILYKPSAQSGVKEPGVVVSPVETKLALQLFAGVGVPGNHGLNIAISDKWHQRDAGAMWGAYSFLPKKPSLNIEIIDNKALEDFA